MLLVKWLGVIAAVVMGYVVYPFYSLHQLQTAVQSGDIQTIEDRIDWPRLREGLKADLGAAMSAEFNEKAQKNDPSEKMAAVFGAALSGPIISSVIDTNVTPAALASVMKGQRGKTAGQPVVDRPFFDGLTSFSATVHNDEGKQARLRFELEGLSWKLTRVYLPIEELRNRH